MAEEKRDSYTKLFNPILEALYRSHELTSAQFAIILFVIRSTYGWHKKKFPMSKAFIAEGTELSERCVIKNVNILVSKGYLIEYGVDRETRSKIYGLNKRYSQWGKGPATLVEGERLDTEQPDTLWVNGEVTMGEQSFSDEGERSDTQKRNIKKKDKKEKEKKCSPEPYFLNPETGMWEEVEDEDGEDGGED